MYLMEFSQLTTLVSFKWNCESIDEINDVYEFDVV